MCDDGGQVYGTGFGLMFSADGEPLFETFDNPDEPVMLDGTRIDDVERIEGTDSFLKPSRTNPGRAEVVYEVVEVRPGEYAVASVMTCDYQTLLDRTAYQP
jgi:hypothetical protein